MVYGSRTKLLVHVEALAATARVERIGIVELERLLQPFAPEVHRGAVEKLERGLVHDDLGIVRLEQRVVGTDFVRIVERVRQPGAADRLHAQPQADAPSTLRE